VCDRLASLGLAAVDSGALLAAEGTGATERAARRLLRSAATPLGARILLDQLGGALEEAVVGIADALAAGRTAEAVAVVDAMLEAWRTCGRYLAEPPRVVIAGRPNVGKSTLLNRLAGRERAITHPEPGTTRDYVETVVAFDGLPVVLVDTAGLRKTAERIEREGVARARQEASRADLVLYLLDATVGVTGEDEKALAQLTERGGSGDLPCKEPDRLLAVWNKADLAAGPLGPPGVLAASARTGEGLDGLRQAVFARLDYRAPDSGAAVPLTGEHADALVRARALLAEGRADEARRAVAALTIP
jgi:tRNA modification GTPase